MSKTTLLSLAALVLAAFIALSPAVDAREQRHYETIFAEAVSEQYRLQVAGTYPARSEVLVKLPNNNQYAVPVAPGSDLSVWKTNELVVVTITQGLVIEIESPSAGAAPGLTYAVLNGTDVLAGIPDDVLVREVQLVTRVTAVNQDTGAITFEAATGDVRTAVAADPAIVKAAHVRPGELLVLTYFDAIDIEPAN